MMKILDISKYIQMHLLNQRILFERQEVFMAVSGLAM